MSMSTPQPVIYTDRDKDHGYDNDHDNEGFTSPAYVALTPGSPSNIALLPVTYPRLSLSSEDLVVDIVAVSLCATDLKAAAGKFLANPPLILGHEGAGIVSAVGKDVIKDWEVGDKVVLSFASCGICAECKEEGEAYCERLGELNFPGSGEIKTTPLESDQHEPTVTISSPDGSSSPTTIKVKGKFFGQSSMGRRVVVRAASTVKLPRDTPERELRMFASLGCGIQTGAGAIINVAGDFLRMKKRKVRVLVFGAGSVGLAACLAVRVLLETDKVEGLVVVDNSREKLSVLPECVREKVTGVFNSQRFQGEELVEKLKGLTTDGRGFDLALDCVGSWEVVKIAHLALRPRGMVVSIGGSTDMALQVTLSQHLGRGITYRGTHQGDSVPSRFIPYLIDLWRAGKFPFDSLLTFYDFEDLQKAIQDVKEGKIIKPVLVTGVLNASEIDMIYK